MFTDTPARKTDRPLGVRRKGELTEVTVGHRVLLDVAAEGAQLLQLELLGVDLVAQPLQAVLLGGQRRAVVMAMVVMAALVVVA